MERVEGFLGFGDGVIIESFSCELETDGEDLCAILLDVQLHDGTVESRRYVPEQTCYVTVDGCCTACNKDIPNTDVVHNYCLNCGARILGWDFEDSDEDE